MAGYIFDGEPSTPGVSFFMADWYDSLFTKVDGLKVAYLAGWANEPGCYLVNGPTGVTMGLSPGIDPSPAVSDNTALGLPALDFNSAETIDSGFDASEDFSLIAVFEITADQINDLSSAEYLFAHVDDTNGRGWLGLNNAENMVFQIRNGQFISINKASLSAGPHVVMATCRKTGTDAYTLSIYIDDFATPAATGAKTGAIDTGVPWFIGGAENGILQWSGGIAAAIIANRDLTEDTADATNTKAALDQAMVWAGMS